MIKANILDNKNTFISEECLVKLRHCGNIKEIIYTQKANTNCYIQKINDNEYVDLRTGELKQANHITNRGENKSSLLKSFKLIRDLINTNCTDNKKIKFITLTYAENMQDTKKLYEDFHSFWKRFKYHFPDVKDYINVAEPQGRGAWHLHCIFIFNNNVPKIDFYELKDLWGYGMIKIKNIANVDNIGAYLTAYLTDIELNEETEKEIKDYIKSGTDNKFTEHMIDIMKINYIEKEIEDISGQKIKKKFVKGR